MGERNFLGELERFFELSFDLAGVLVEGRLQRLNPSWESSCGWPLEALQGRLLQELVQAEDWENFEQAFAALEEGEEVVSWEGRFRRQEGTYKEFFWRAARGEEGALCLVARDRSEHRLTDALTGLPNRVLFLDRLAWTMERADSLFAVLLLDLDRFKNVNDSLGHVVGDRLLIEVSRKLQEGLKSGDSLARLGGDEFAVLLHDIRDITDATRMADWIQRVLSEPVILDNHEVVTSASIGIALSKKRYNQAEEVLRDADNALNRAKEQGKACYEFFETNMHLQAVHRLHLETFLRRALEEKTFRVFYQPIVSLDTGRVAGFEALLRWRSPELGAISPESFIPIAEETGLIIPLGYWVLRESCQQLKRWLDLFPHTRPLQLSVNLSPKQFYNEELVEQIEELLYELELPPSSLKLEITESVIMDHPEAIMKIFLRLKELGLSFSMDDFGTGYSSLSYLHRYPFDTLKIDRSFVSTMEQRNQNAEIVQTITILAHNLGMDVTAEGVETPQQLSYLRALECEYVQGYLLSKPLPASDAEALLAEEEAS